MDFLIRKPRFPAIVDTGVELLGVRSWTECQTRFSNFTSSDTDAKPVIDASAEGFAFHPDMAVISPLALKKRWSKSEIIALYNDRKNSNAPRYEPASLSNRTLARVVADVVELLNER